MKIVSRAISRIDLFVEPWAKFLHQNIIKLIAKTILPTLSYEVELNFKPMRIHTPCQELSRLLLSVVSSLHILHIIISKSQLTKVLVLVNDGGHGIKV